MPGRDARGRRPHTGVGLADVAAKAGVSTSTVSRVLNNYSEGFSVKPQIRQRILDAADAMGYQPNGMARNLRAQRTGLIAIVGLHFGSTLSPGVSEKALGHMSAVLNAAGIDVCSTLMGARHGRYDLPNWRFDGAAVASAWEEEDLEPLEKRRIPYVSINCVCGPSGVSIAVDDVGGTRLAMQHLLELGHRRIAYANLFTRRHTSVTLRHETYRAMMKESGLESIESGPRRTTFDLRPAIADEFVRDVVIGARRTAVLVYDHMAAIDILGACRRHGLSIPHDVSLICFNNLFPNLHLEPPLTCIELPIIAMGEAAAAVLLEQTRPDAPPIEPREIMLPETLVVRGSTAPPRD